jgi:hypothetical protein
VVYAFRRADNTDAASEFRLRGLEPQTRYVVRRLNVGGDEGRREFAGRQLLESGLPITIEERPGVAVITYQQIREE